MALSSPSKDAGDPGRASEQDRIQRLRNRYQTGPAVISVERARYYTRSWKDTSGRNLASSVRVALAMKHVYENMTCHVDRDDRIAGCWTEHFLGIPIDIERGVFNKVFSSELTRSSMVRFRLGSAARALWYIVRKGALDGFIRNQRITKSVGAQPLNMDFKTMAEREINPFLMDGADRRELLEDLLPHWEGKTLVDALEKQMAESKLYSEDMREFALALPGNTSRQVLMLSTCATIATYQGHVILDYENAIRTGLDGMKESVERKLEGEALAPGERNFLQSQLIAIEGVAIFCRRTADRIEEEIDRESDADRSRELRELLAVCRRVPHRAAGSFREAVQALWSIKTAVELAHPVNLHCFGRLDQILQPYYAADLQAGRVTPEGALYLLQELLLKIMSQNIRPETNLLSNFYHRFLGSSPVTIGGIDRDGADATNELTHLVAKAAHESRAVTNISVRVNRAQPESLMKEIASYISEGTSSFSFFNDDICVKAMQKRGFEEDDARDYAVMGCVETTCPGKTGSMSANALQLAKLLDITLRNGDSAILAGTIRGEGLQSGDPDGFADFDQFLEAFFRQAEYFMDKIVEGSNLRDDLFARVLPAPCVSAFMDGCLDSMKDVTAGGAVYDLAGISLVNSVANLVDSLYAIRTLVYEGRIFTISQLLEALDHNFMGHEEIRRAIDGLSGKWGNGNEDVDRFASTVMKRLCDLTYRYRTSRGGPFVVYVISMITHTIDGRLSLATPDGRGAATPFAASCNPYNVERSGTTAALRSISSLPFEDVMGCAVNMKFHPSAIGETDETRAKWASLIRTYFRMGGSQLQPTCVSTELLRAARERPDEHRDLIVKVGGYSTYFVDMGREIQDEIIARTEHGTH